MRGRSLSAKEREWKLQGALEFHRSESSRMRAALEKTTRALRLIRRNVGEPQTDGQRSAVVELERVIRLGEEAQKS
jgi:hypothetical protein